MSKAYIKCPVTFIRSTEDAVLVKAPMTTPRWIPNKCLSEESIAAAFYAAWGQDIEIDVQEWKAKQARLI